MVYVGNLFGALLDRIEAIEGSMPSENSPKHMDETTKSGKSGEQDIPQTPSPLDFKRDDDFVSLYANNVRFEPNVWDLKMVFGELDQSTGTTIVDQHTAISVSWRQAKLLAYYVGVNLIIHEADNGPVYLPPSVIPAPFDPALVADTPRLVPVWELLAAMHKRFFPEYYPRQTQADHPKSGQTTP
jgi:hypothetical protein